MTNAQNAEQDLSPERTELHTVSDARLDHFQTLQRQIARFVPVTRTPSGVSMNAFRADWGRFPILEQQCARRASLATLLIKQA